MKRFDHAYDSQGTVGESEGGKYVLYEEARVVEVDRDIKAANLKTLVDMVLAYDTAADRLEDHEEGGGLDHVEIMTAYDRMVRLARGLKQ